MIVDFLSLFSKRSIFSTLGLTLLVGLTSWIAVKSTDSYKFTENPPKDFIANQGYGFEYEQYRPSGTIAYKGNAESVVRLENGQSKMQQLAIKIYPQNSASRPWHVDATKAKSFKKTKVIHLSEQVTIKHPGNSKQSKPALKITMPKASVFPEKNYAETDSPVKLIEQDSPNVLTGVGLKAWFKPLKIKLLSQVRGFYNQKRTKLNDDQNATDS
jgi:LPS export ABC transporter protein LptC